MTVAGKEKLSEVLEENKNRSISTVPTSVSDEAEAKSSSNLALTSKQETGKFLEVKTETPHLINLASLSEDEGDAEENEDSVEVSQLSTSKGVSQH